MCFRLLLAAIALVIGVSWDTAAIAAEKSLTAPEVLKHIEEVGAKKALEEYWKSGEFIQILHGIGTANPKWLEVYVRLQPVSDAGSSEDLADAIYNEALSRAPFRVIRIIKKVDKWNEGDSWNVESVCTFGFDAQCPPDGIWSYLDRLERNLSKAKTPWEKSVRNVCMKGIHEARIQFPKKRAIDWCRYGIDGPPKENQPTH